MMKSIANVAVMGTCLLLASGCAQLSIERPLAANAEAPLATPPGPTDLSAWDTPRVDVSRYPSFHPLRRSADNAARDASRQAAQQRHELAHARDPSPLLEQDLIAIGYASITAQKSADAAQQRLMAARASRLDAYRNLAEQVYGLTVLAETSVNNDLLRDDRLRAQLMGFISGAELIAMEPLGNDTYQTTLRLSAAQVASLRAQVR